MAGIAEERIKTLCEKLKRTEESTEYTVLLEGVEDSVDRTEKMKRAVRYCIWKFDDFSIGLPSFRKIVRDTEKNRIPPAVSDDEEFAKFEKAINAAEESTNSCNREQDSSGEKKDLHETERKEEDLMTPEVATNVETTDTHRDDTDDFAYEIGPKRIAFFIGVGEFEKRGDDGENDGTGHFDNDLKRTSELGKDKDNMKRAFVKLGFQFECNQGCFTTNVKQFINNHVLDHHEKWDIIVVVISSHGEEATEIDRATQSKTTRHRFLTEDSYIYTDDLIEMFNTTELKEIPKLFFIQACRSGLSAEPEDTKDEGVGIEILEGEITGDRSDAADVIKPKDIAEARARGPKGQTMAKKVPDTSATPIDTSKVESARGISEDRSTSDIIPPPSTSGVIPIPSTSDIIPTPSTSDIIPPTTSTSHAIATPSTSYVTSTSTSDIIPPPSTSDVMPTPSTSDIIPPTTSTSHAIPTPSTSYVTSASTSDIIPPPSTSDVIPTPSTSDIIPPPCTSDVIPTPSTSDIISPPSTSDVIPTPSTSHDTSTTSISDIIPPTSTFGVIPTPSTSDIISPPSTSDVIPTPSTSHDTSTTSISDIIPPTSTFGVIPTTSTSDVIPTTSTSDVIPTPSTSNVVPATGTSDVIPTAAGSSEVTTTQISETTPVISRKLSRRVKTEIEPADDTAVRPFTCAPDCLVMYASAPGKIAYRRSNVGGWFISALSEGLLAWSDEKNKDQDLLQILTSVIREVSLYVATEEEKDDHGKTTEHEFKSAACLTHMLIKDVYLQKLSEQKE